LEGSVGKILEAEKKLRTCEQVAEGFILGQLVVDEQVE